jgi:hypothetical protein
MLRKPPTSKCGQELQELKTLRENSVVDESHSCSAIKDRVP